VCVCVRVCKRGKKKLYIQLRGGKEEKNWRK